MYLHNRPAGHAGPFPLAQVLPSHDQHQDDSVNKVGEREVESP